MQTNQQDLRAEMEALRTRLEEAEETLRAIREGEVDALLVSTKHGNRVYTLENADSPYRALVEAMLEGAATLSHTGLILYCNQRFAEMLHLPLERVLGESIHTFIAPNDRLLFESLVRQQSRNHRAELWLCAANDTLIPVSVAVNALPLSDTAAVCLVATDLSVQHQREQEIMLLQELQRLVSEAETFESALHLVLRRIVEMTQVSYGEAWSLSVDRSTLQCSAAHFGESAGADLKELLIQHHATSWSRNMIEDAWNSREMVILSKGFLIGDMLKAGVVIPVMADEEVVSVLALFAEESYPINEHFIRIVSLIASQLGAFIRRRQMEDDIERARQDLEVRVLERTAELRRSNQALEYQVAERIRVADQITHLQKVTTAFSAALTSREVAEVMVRQGFKLAGASRGAIFALSNDERFLRLLRAKDCTSKQLCAWQNVPLFTSSGALAQSVRTKQARWNLAQEHLIRQVVSDNGLPPTNRIRPTLWAAVPLRVANRIIGVLALGFPKTFPFDAEKMSVVQTITEQCAQVLHRVQLYEQVQVAAALEERQRLARELHDAVSQTLFSASMMAEALPLLFQRNPETAMEGLSKVARQVRAASAELRTLLLELRPASLVNVELDALITQLTQAIQGRKQIEFSITIPKPCLPLPTDVHLALYRIVQEAFNNIVKHSRATQVSVLLSSTPEGVELRIRDNGSGFDMQNYRAGLGLGMMGERAEAIGAIFNMESVIGQGTEIRVSRAAHAP